MFYADHVPTVSTQLSILSSVKAATPEDRTVSTLFTLPKQYQNFLCEDIKDKKAFQYEAYLAPAPIACAPIATTRCYSGEGGAQMNKFEQVSSDDHQMSLAGGPGLGQGQGCKV